MNQTDRLRYIYKQIDNVIEYVYSTHLDIGKLSISLGYKLRQILEGGTSRPLNTYTYLMGIKVLDIEDYPHQFIAENSITLYYNENIIVVSHLVDLGEDDEDN
jgi:hypothetical protein